MFKKPLSLKQKRIVISKTNRIGDVLCALPMVSAIKRKEPHCHVIFLGSQYAQDVILQYADIDEFVAWDTWPQEPAQRMEKMKALQADIILHVLADKHIARCAKKAGIPYRIGTSHRTYHWLTCNRRLDIGRSKMRLHEAQFDFMHLEPLGFKSLFSLDEIIQLRSFKPFHCPASVKPLLSHDKFNLILHPKTFIEKREWPLAHFAQLIAALNPDQFTIFITGTEKDGEKVRRQLIMPFAHVHDLTGKLTLRECIHFIAHADGLIAASTGPLHVAANVGIHTLGLYTPVWPYEPTRWGPIGEKAETLTATELASAEDLDSSLASISVKDVVDVVQRWRAP